MELPYLGRDRFLPPDEPRCTNENPCDDCERCCPPKCFGCTESIEPADAFEARVGAGHELFCNERCYQEWREGDD